MLRGEELEATRHLSICPLLHVTPNAFRKQWQLCRICLLNLTQVLALASSNPYREQKLSSGTHSSQLNQADTTHSNLNCMVLIGFHWNFSPTNIIARPFSYVTEYSPKLIWEEILMTCNSLKYPSIIGDLRCFLLFCVTNSPPVTLYAYISLSVSLIFPGNGFLEKGLLSLKKKKVNCYKL